MRVLIADRDEAYLEMLQSYLWDRGYEAEVATDGLECMVTLRHFLPDVLILDHDLRWGGSEGILAQMQNDPALSEIPVIMIADSDEKVFDLANYPVAACLQKPIRLSDLPKQIADTKHYERFVRELVHAK